MPSAKKNHSSKKSAASSHDHREEDQQAITKILETDRLSTAGPIADFEERTRAYTGSQHAIAVSTVTAGLQLCFQAAGIKPGDLVITTPLSSINSLNVLLNEGAVPVFIDVEPRTGNIDPHLVFAAVQDIMQGGKNAQAWLPPKGATPDAKLKAILVVDLLGQPADFELILNTAWKYKIKVIEDASAALGAAYKGHQAGTLGDYGVSGYPLLKSDATWEAGMVITDEIEAASLMRDLRDQGARSANVSLPDTHLRNDYRLDETSAALAFAYLQRLDERMLKLGQVAGWYRQRLAEIPGIEPPNLAKYITQASWPVYVVRLASHLDRDAILGKLAAHGINAQPYFTPAHLQPAMVEKFGYGQGTFPVTDDLSRRALSLPISDVMDERQVDHICQVFSQVI